MKVINHHDGNYRSLSACSACYYGTIEMTMKEFIHARDILIEYIRDHKNNYEINNTKWIIKEAIPKKQYNNTWATTFRVTYTEILFELLNLPRYKPQNYIIVIKGDININDYTFPSIF